MVAVRFKEMNQKNDIKNCKIYYKDRYDYHLPYKSKDMYIVSETDLFTYYETSISVKWNRYRYFFELTDFNNFTQKYLL